MQYIEKDGQKDFLGETFYFKGYIHKCKCSTLKGVYLIVNSGFNNLEVAGKSFAGNRINKTPERPYNL